MPTKLLFPAFFLLCNGLIAQTVDTIPPMLKCKQLLSFNLLNTVGCSTPLYAVDLVDSLYDEASPSAIALSMQFPCESDTFINRPAWTFNADFLGASDIEIWAKDPAGNIGICQTTILVGDLGGSCDPSGFYVYPENYLGEGLPNTKFKIININPCAHDTAFQIEVNTITAASGSIYAGGPFSPVLYPGFETHFIPSRPQNPLNGVTSFDLVMISLHVSGIAPFPSVYQYIAADANEDGFVTMADIVLLRKLILGVIDELPSKKSWRFIPKDYVFPVVPSILNPLSPVPPDRTIVPRSNIGAYTSYNNRFIGIKIGDVNFNANPAE